MKPIFALCEVDFSQNSIKYHIEKTDFQYTTFASITLMIVQKFFNLSIT